MATEKRYWAGLEDLHETEEFKKSRDNEFPSELPVEEFVAKTDSDEMTTGRRDFLKFLGFGVGAATLAACETPVTRIVPYVNKPEEVTPGMPQYYASTYFDGMDYASILVKTREGRPIHIKGNKDHGHGGASARIIGSVLSLYDSARLTGPTKGGEPISWETADAEVGASLTSGSGDIVFLTNTIASPSTAAALDRFKAAMGNTKVDHIMVDPISYEGMRKANMASFGKSVLPWYNFDKADVVVSVGADFMNDWPMSDQYQRDFAKTRRPELDKMSKHFQFETIMSVAGSNADVRHAIKPSQEGLVLASILKGLGKGGSVDTSAVDAMTAEAVADLKAARGRSIVISGSNDPNVQFLANAINETLGNYRTTIDLNKEVRTHRGSTADLAGLIERMNSGRVKALFVRGVNPAYDSALAAEFKEALAKVPMTASFSGIADETASICNYILPESHYLESWDDHNVIGDHYATQQPVIRPLYDSRQFQDNLLKWSGSTESYYEFLKGRWEARGGLDLWNNTVFKGSTDMPATNVASIVDAISDGLEQSATVTSGMSMSSALAAVASTASQASGMEVMLYTKMGIGAGQHVTNPWMQELPDPITKVCWDNYITLAQADTDANGFQRYIGEQSPASLATVTVNGRSITLPVVTVPGQKAGTIGIALGYGRGANGENIGKAAFQTKEYGGYDLDDNNQKKPIGANAYPFVRVENGVSLYSSAGATLAGTGETYPLAATQTHHTVMGRTSVVKETSHSTYKSGDHDSYNHPHVLAMHEDGETVMKPVSEVDLWDEHPVEDIGHWWGMNIDLTTCTGCSACVTACHSENNVPVVGKDEVRRARDMHWLRIDRYFSSDMTKERGADEGLGKIDMYGQMENPSDNPSVVHMPMMCQHCNHAPCETVCPVAATTHSSEGINQMTYNRCIGTRYCANNCPYKVRRFNWFNYKAYGKFTEVNPSQDVMGRLVLNPDVTVRSRGVMEKCSMCMQRIQAGKLKAKLESTPVADGAVTSACADACPTNAITFGDRNDKNSLLVKKEQDPRTYISLEEVGARPSISYQAVVRNVDTNNA